MAKIGAKYPAFKPNNAVSGIILGRLNAANVTLNSASGEIWGDDIRAEYLSEFSDGSIAMETTNLSDENATVVFGHASFNGRVKCNSGDLAPEGRFAYYRVLMVNGVKYYKAFGYYRVRAVLGNENDQTKSNNITFTTDSVTFQIMTLDNGDWREYETYESEPDAIAFVKDFCGIVDSDDSASLASLSLGSVALTPAFNPGITEYRATTTNATNTVTAEAADDAATVTITNGTSAVTNGNAATWASGVNTLTITVVNGTASKAYTVLVTKAAS